MILSFDKKKLQSILDSFFMVSGIHSAVFDDKGRGIAWSQNMVRSPLCDMLRKIPSFDEACRACDRAACLRCRASGQGEQYRCHIGLEEFVVPIVADHGIIVGYIISGQLIPYGRREETLPQVLAACQPYGVDEETLTRAYLGQRELEPDIVDAAFEILQACTAHVWVTKAASINEGSLAFRISDYIKNNLSGDLSVSALCETLLISKARLNRLAQVYFGMSPQHYVRRLRLEEGKNLLIHTDESIGQIAARVGIPDYNYFSKVFKAQEGVSPRDYRKGRESSLLL